MIPSRSPLISIGYGISVIAISAIQSKWFLNKLCCWSIMILLRALALLLEDDRLLFDEPPSLPAAEFAEEPIDRE